MTQQNILVRSLRAALAVGLATASVVPFAYSQDESEDEATQLEGIVVTGSRIRQATLETATPVTVITREEIKQQGFRNVADILQNLSAAGTPPISRASPLSAGEAVGGQFISLRNLGAARTLVLLNGRRLGITTGGIQDISIIPASIIERVEVLKDGGSSIYGSDAIAGVINLITRENLNGIETNGYIGEYEEGDGRVERFDVSMGAGNETTSITMILDYANEERVSAFDREYTKFPLGPDFPDRNFTTVGQFGGFVTSATQVVPGIASGTRVTLRPGGNPNVPADYVVQQTGPTDNRFTTNTLEQTDLRTPLSQRQMFVGAKHNFSDTLRLRAEALYSGREASRQVAGFPLQATNGPAPLSSTSIFNPFSAITTNANGTRTAAGTSTIANWWRRTWEVPRVSDSNLEAWRGILALDGSFDLWDRSFNWDANGMYQINRQVQKTFGNINLTRLRAAVGPSFINAGGQAQCGTPTAPIPLGVGQNSCVPFNPFLSFGVPGLGGLTGNQQLQEFLFQTETANGETATSMFSANLTGSIVELPAGSLSFATGVELRRERGEFIPDALAVTGESTNLSSRATRGDYGVDEIYAEFRIPLLADLPFVRSLEITAASRYSDYDTFGDTTNSKAGLEYRPTDELLIRGTWAEGFRAPTISNLFAGGSQSFVSYTDPCDPVFGQAATNQTVRTNCARDIANYANFRQLRQGFTPVQGPNEQTPLAFFQGTGNAELTPESSESIGFGVVYSPNFVEGLNLSLDYWLIDIDDLIIGDTIGQILADCYVSGVQSRCASSLFTRDPVRGIVSSANIGLRNAGYNEVEGYDLGINYRLETDFGNFSVNNQTSYTSRDEFKSSDDPAILPTQNVSFGSTFRIRSNTTFGWNMGAWGVNWTTRYFSAIKETCLAATLPGRVCTDPNYIAANPAQTRAINRTGSVSFNDLQVRYNAPWDATISVGANNVLDRVGPTLYTQPSANVSYYGGFDIGRFWYLSYSQRF